MPYFKDVNGGLHFLDNDSDSYLLPSGSVQISDDEANTIISNANKISQKQKILDEILSLEQSVTPRRYRESVLGKDNGWLSNIDNQIQILRSQLNN